MINRLVIENLKHRPVRTGLSAVAIGVQVTMVLTLVGISQGMLEDMARRSKGTGADVIIRAPGSSIIGFSTDFTSKILPFVQKMPEVELASGTLVQPIGQLDSVTGVDLDTFSRMSGGFRYVEGGPFQGPNDILVDEVYSRGKKVHAGQTIKDVLNQSWRVAGVVESGKLSRMFIQLPYLQELTSKSDKLTVLYVKLKDPAQTNAFIAKLRTDLPDYKVYSTEEFASLISIDNIPVLKTFIRVIIGLGVFVGFLVVFLSMYTAVLERTREIGILKSLGASPPYILSILLRETALLALIGSALGILFTFGTKWAMNTLVPSMTQVIVPEWWPIASAIALTGSLVGAIYPGLKAARQDAIEALAYD